MNKEIWKLLNERVKVRAFGIEYTGIFKGADEDWVFLQCETTWVQIPWLEITSFVPADAPEEAKLYQQISEDPAQKSKKTKRVPKPKPELKVIEGKKYLGDEEPILEDDSEPEKKD